MEIRVPMDVLRQQKIMLCTPMYGGQCAGIFTRSMQDLITECTKANIPILVYYLFNESLITRARNYCADEFMRSDATHFVFIDSDIGFSAKDVLSMVAMQCMPGNNYDIVGGPYHKKCISWEKVRMAVDKGYGDPQNPNEQLRDSNILENFIGDFVFNPKQGTATFKISEPVEVMEIGTGFMSIKRSAMERFSKRFPRAVFRPDHVRTEQFDGSRMVGLYFQAAIDEADPYEYLYPALKKIAGGLTGDPADYQEFAAEAIKSYEEADAKKSKRYLSEDYWFCQKSIEAGCQVWFCPWMGLKHIGAYTFGGTLGHLAAIGAPATADPRMLNKKGPVVKSVPVEVPQEAKK